MNSLRFRKSVLSLVAGALLAITGCSPGLSALAKFQSGDIGSLSASDWQALAGLASSVGVAVPQLSADQASAVVKFLDDNNIQTTEQLESLLRSGNVKVPAELAGLLG